jgi:hypothetical protein
MLRNPLKFQQIETYTVLSANRNPHFLRLFFYSWIRINYSLWLRWRFEFVSLLVTTWWTSVFHFSLHCCRSPANHFSVCSSTFLKINPASRRLRGIQFFHSFLSSLKTLIVLDLSIFISDCTLPFLVLFASYGDLPNNLFTILSCYFLAHFHDHFYTM